MCQDLLCHLDTSGMVTFEDTSKMTKMGTSVGYTKEINNFTDPLLSSGNL